MNNPTIKSLYNQYLSTYQKERLYFSDPKNYSYQTAVANKKSFNQIDINLYKIFIERSNQILKENGIFGMIVPTGICSDLGTQSLRRLIFDQCQVTKKSEYYLMKKKIYQTENIWLFLDNLKHNEHACRTINQPKN